MKIMNRLWNDMAVPPFCLEACFLFVLTIIAVHLSLANGCEAGVIKMTLLVDMPKENCQSHC